MEDSQKERVIDMVDQLKESATNCGLLLMQGIVVMRCPGSPTYLTGCSLIVISYAGFQWYQGGGIIWRLLVGLFGYLFLAGVWQAWVHRRK